MTNMARYCCCGCRPRLWLVISGLDASLCACSSDTDYTVPTLDGTYELVRLTSDDSSGRCYYSEAWTGTGPSDYGITISGFTRHEHTPGRGCVGASTDTAFSAGIIVDIDTNDVVRSIGINPSILPTTTLFNYFHPFGQPLIPNLGVALPNGATCAGIGLSIADGGTATLYAEEPP